MFYEARDGEDFRPYFGYVRDLSAYNYQELEEENNET